MTFTKAKRLLWCVTELWYSTVIFSEKFRTVFSRKVQYKIRYFFHSYYSSAVVVEMIKSFNSHTRLQRNTNIFEW